MVQVLVGAAVAFVAAVLATPVWVAFLRRRRLGQPIHDAVRQHQRKAGTPTMGGLVIWLGMAAGYASARLVGGGWPTRAAGEVVVVTVAAGLVGLVDDWLKIRRGRNLGLREAQKTVMLLAVVGLFCTLHLLGPSPCTSLSLTTCSSTGLHLGSTGWAVMALAVFWLTTNSVNFTDGIEGLLAGSGAVTFSALVAMGFWQFRHPAGYRIADPLGMAVVAAALVGACGGFLWWNIRPATIFMGDTGSLAVGGALAALVLSMNIVGLLPLLAALYVAEGASSALQRYSYKLYFRHRPGQRRLFRMAPLHHHFELAGWSEGTIVVRFWIISGLAAVASGAVFFGAALRWR